MHIRTYVVRVRMYIQISETNTGTYVRTYVNERFTNTYVRT